MKKMFAVIVCLTLCNAALFAQTEADFETEPDGDGVVITEYTGPDGAVVIPARIGGKVVTGIGEDAFYDCTGLTSVTIPASVTTIGEWAFSGCSGLTSVTIPASVTSIGRGAFSDCTGLTSVTIPASVTTIGEGAFFHCTGLTSVTIPASVTSIGGGAFAGCSGLTTISVSPANRNYQDRDGVLFTKDGTTLHTCPAGTAQTVYVIPSGVTTIGEAAFYGCIGLTSVTIPEGVITIGEAAFYGCSGLTSVTIPAGVTTIGWWAFYGCTGLRPEVRAEIERRFGSDVF